MTRVHPEGGFTLTEMLVVLGLVALVAAVSMPYARHSNDARELTAAARSVTAVLRDARTLALLNNRPTEVAVNVETLTVAGPSGHAVKLPLGTELLLTTDRERIGRASGGLSFFPDGGSTGGKLVLKRGTETREIAINWLTGTIALAEQALP